MINLFIATAMSNLTKEEYKELQTAVHKIKENHPEYEIFSEITTIKDQDNFMTPKEATILDINEIHKCQEFVLIHLSNVQSSTLFELGLAYTLNKRITIFYKDENDLPFMLKELDQVSYTVELIKIETLKDIVLN